ncbi:MAG: type VI secretion system protein TssA [Vicinamibacterales bacterium]
MSARWEGGDLLQPIEADRPCGENLEDTPLLASFDAFRLYGRTKPLEPTPDSGEGRPKTLEDRDERPPDWGDIKSKSLEALSKSKDLRLLVHLGTAVLRTDGLGAFVETIKVASQWLDAHWDETYPLVDGDGILRRSALNCYADPIAVVDAVRRAPIVKSRQHGIFSLREIDIASGQAQATGSEPRPDEARINAAFSTVPLEELAKLQQGVGNALASLKRIDDKMKSEIGAEAAPGFEPLSAQLAKIDRALRVQVAARPGGAAVDAEEAQGVVTAGPGTGPVSVGVIRSREDAVRSLDAVAEFFRKNEPSSPVPLFCERAKRLVSKDFLEVLAEVVPDAVGAARAAGGLKSGE